VTFEYEFVIFFQLVVFTTFQRVAQAGVYWPPKYATVSHDSRDPVDEFHLSLVADAGQICIHILTSRTSCWLINLSRRRVEAAASAAVVMPAVRTW